MDSFFLTYTVVWILFCVLAAGVAFGERATLGPEWRQYIQFLGVPWKLFVFIPALLFVTFAGPFTNDETWDVVTGGGMSLLTFLTAPWALGVVYQVCTGKRAKR